MSNQSSESGFPPHVWGQLQQAAHSTNQRSSSRGRGRGFNRGRGFGPQHRDAPQDFSAQGWGPPPQPPSDMSAYPPLGSTHPQPMAQQGFQSTPAPTNQPMNPGSYGRGQATSNDARNFFEHARNDSRRGGYQRGRGYPAEQSRPTSVPNSFNPRFHSQPHSSNQFTRPPPPQNRTLYLHAMNLTYGTYEQQHARRQKIMMQADQLERVARPALQKGISLDEQKRKERFRKNLEQLVRNAIVESDLQFIDPKHVELKAYGSSVNGFALAKCDMDLLLSLPDTDTQSDETRVDVAKTFGRVVGATLLKTGYGARLLTHTRVPILKICELPSPELLQNLRQKWVQLESELDAETVPSISNDQPPMLTDVQLQATTQALEELNMDETPANISLPDSPTLANAKVEFSGDCGIECDITFVRKIALVNSQLLRTYSSCDERVRKLGIFVKSWAKARGINEPYYGTLSSYGYILMVLHYCMNIVNPPLIPNLQVLARSDDDWQNRGVVIPEQEFDTRFVSDPERINELMRMIAPQRNHDSLGKLIAGFFMYYTSQQGFHWTRDIISIRTWGGILSKQQKGWTSANQIEGHRNRYLLAIEDPFELDHNVGRVVGHHGIVAIRDELRRAQRMIEAVGLDAEVESLENLLDVVEARRDTHREDQQHHREKLRRLRQLHDAKEKAALQDNEKDTVVDAVIQAENGSFKLPAAQHDIDGMWKNPDGAFKSKPKSAHKRLTQAKALKDRSNRAHGGRIRKCKPTDSEDDDSDNDAVEDEVVTSDYRSDSNQDHHDEQIKAENYDEFNAASSTYYKEAQKEDPKGTNESAKDSAKKHQAHYPEKSNKDDAHPNFTTLSDEESVLRNHGFDVWGKLKAFNVQSKEGSFLAQRDEWVIAGTYRPPKNPYYATLDRACPYDPARPPPDDSCPYDPLHEQKPQWPKVMLEDGTTPTGEKLVSIGRMKVRMPIYTKAGGWEARIVGPKISWDFNTKAGRWLRFRDRALRENMEWRVPNDCRQLHIDFPYNPDMTRLELQDKNSELRLHYWNSYHRVENKAGSPNQASVMPERVVAELQLHSLWSDEGEVGSKTGVAHKTDPETPKHEELTKGENNCHTNPVADVQPTSLDLPLTEDTDPSVKLLPPPTDSNLQQTTVPDTGADVASPTVIDETSKSSPDLAFIRQQRLAFYSKESPTTVAPAHDNVEVTDSETHGPNVIDLMISVGIAQQTSVQGCDSTAVPSSHSLQHDLVQKVDTLKDAEPVEEWSLPSARFLSHGSRAQDLIMPTEESMPALVRDISASPPEHEILVPDTLYPHLKSDQRPRDEDPRIMPIPRKLGFLFDPRQLRDLSVIKEGGNGCARSGQEYNVEDEYEFGGGGQMACRSSTARFTDYGYSTNRNGWAPGTGDEDGLLDELPGL